MEDFPWHGEAKTLQKIAVVFGEYYGNASNMRILVAEHAEKISVV